MSVLPVSATYSTPTTPAPAPAPTPAFTPANVGNTVCLWDDGSGNHCGANINLSDLRIHLRTHGVKGPAKSVVSCAWDDCGRDPMKKESIIRHVKEVHLRVKHRCGQCGASFSRQSTRNTHLQSHTS
ncbi:hypothetical protein DEU56DRAFT_751847 [Suillus clintonianus]|uniref:uncharacterized protein n=1 Tax=Suillus clintonianus TaxID=1904413 RepID=UPI001B882D65|nr:uncharacterized protein DEU56DRAFT_751847 [Suillus clintonianus]KAG2153247.1 hypothetical protein DEU56DRAFT_751847 [Suillus clintonianus]